jgi:hypothetical protein
MATAIVLPVPASLHTLTHFIIAEMLNSLAEHHVVKSFRISWRALRYKSTRARKQPEH